MNDYIEDEINREEKRIHEFRFMRAQRIKPYAQITQAGKHGFFYREGREIVSVFMKWPRSKIAEGGDQFGRVED